MPAPYDYTIKATNPFLAGLQGYQMAQAQRQQAMKIEQEKMAMAQAQRQQQRQMEFQDRMAAIAQNPYGSGEAYNQLAAQYPEMMKLSEQVRGMRSEQQLKNDVSIVQKINAAMAAGNYDVAKAQMEEYKNGLQNSGRQNEMQSIDNMIGMMDDPEKRKEIAVGLNNYLRSQMGAEEYLKYFDQIAKTAGAAKKQKTGSFVVKDKETDEYSIVTGSFDPMSGELSVSSGKLPGSWEMVSDLGETKEEKLKSAVKETAQKKTAELSIAAGDKAATQVMNIMQAQEPMDEAIRIVEDAIANNKWTGTGPIAKYWPKWTSTAANLQSVANRLGLAELSKVTLGAVSEKEMDIVQQASFPKDLSPPDLLKWLKDRKAAQNKIAAVLTDYASYVGKTDKDGNIQTQSDWLNNRAPRFKGGGQTAPTSAEQTTNLVPGQTQTTREVPITEKLKSASTADLFNQLQQSMGQ